jgi:[acyl-carrier-protein] S-malonyltransferase
VARLRPDLLELARESLEGEDPFDRFGEGTQFDQPAIYCASVTAFELVGRPGADFHAGHSLGELAALACAGAIDDRDGLRVVCERGRLMAEAAERSGAGAMLAVGAAAEELAGVIDGPNLCLANLNSPSQTVLSGTEAAIEAVADRLRSEKLRTKRLPVAGAFHSPAMAPAALAFERTLSRFEITEPGVPVISSRSARPFVDPRRELAAALLDPVRWIEVVRWLQTEDVSRFVEVGPGRALSGLVRRSAEGQVTAEAIPMPGVAEAAGA